MQSVYLFISMIVTFAVILFPFALIFKLTRPSRGPHKQ